MTGEQPAGADGHHDLGHHDDGAMADAKRVARWADDFQRRHPWVGFPFAVIKKFGDDRAGDLAALIAYYGFFSLFPLLLVLVTVLGFVLHGHPSLQQRVLDSALAQFPVIGTQLRQDVHSLSGSGTALAVGIAGTLWGGLGVCRAMQEAVNDLWGVPLADRPNFLGSLGRNLAAVAVAGAGLMATTVASGIGTSGSRGLVTRAAAVLVSAWFDVGLFLLAFKLLSAADVGWRDLLLGAVIAGIAWQALQLVGAYYVGHQLKGASQVYGTFALVIGLLSWLYLQAQVMLLALEVDVVRVRHLWPRALVQPPLTPADERAYRSYAKREIHRPEERVDVQFLPGGSG